MARPKFSQPQRQISIAFQALIKNLYMAGTVHRFNRIVAIFSSDGKHIIAKLVRMTRLFPQTKVYYLWRFNFLVALLNLFVTHKRFNGFINTPTLLMPKD